MSLAAHVPISFVTGEHQSLVPAQQMMEVGSFSREVKVVLLEGVGRRQYTKAAHPSPGGCLGASTGSLHGFSMISFPVLHLG